jgi:hypothetical protein
VRHIQKGSEPESFTEWKLQENENWQPNWGNFGKPEKGDVHEALLQEQGISAVIASAELARKSVTSSIFSPEVNTLNHL